MGKSAAMVQAKVVKGGGAGMYDHIDCDTIFKAFDPPIEFGSYKDEKFREKWRQTSNAEGNKGNWQAEHVPPCSNFHVSGRHGTNIPGCSNYSTDHALTWMVHDGQTVGEEHRILTEQMRNFSQANESAVPPKHATLKEWMDEYEKAAKKALAESKDRKVDSKYNREALAARAAKCIRDKMDEFFNEKVGDPPAPRVAQDTPLRNGQAEGKPPAAPPPNGPASGSTVSSV